MVRMVSSRRGRPVILALLAAMLIAFAGMVNAPVAVADPPANPVVGTYTGEIRQAPNVDNVKRIDVAATITALQAGNINTFA